MKQGLLPLMPSGATAIDDLCSVFSDGTQVTWFQGSRAMRVHPVADHATQRAMMAFLHVHGGVPQSRIAAAVGAPRAVQWCIDPLGAGGDERRLGFGHGHGLRAG
ncbi:MAG: hypothetical protein JXR77_15085 [Lentisphaeria bacterium]|nr:hypothetical protein [Lentisphaeria bacterium]